VHLHRGIGEIRDYDNQKTLDSCGFLRCRENRTIAAKYSHTNSARAMLCDDDDRATSRERVVVAYFSLGRFGVFQ
jgi:hypothetical protein